MKRFILCVLCALALSAGAGDVRDIELVATPGSNAVATATAKTPFDGYIISAAIDVAAGSTGVVMLAVTPKASTMDAREVLNTNGITADAWIDPSDSASRRYAFTDSDTFTLTVTNLTVTAKQYRAVVRVESAK